MYKGGTFVESDRATAEIRREQTDGRVRDTQPVPT